MMVGAFEFWTGLALDLTLGDPRWLPHPVVAMGRAASALERLARQCRLPLRLAGGLVWLTVVGATAGFVAATLPLGRIASIYWIFSCLAIRSLDDHARPVFAALAAADLSRARLAVSHIVGRDTAQLDATGVSRAVVETVAESLCDGVIAPLFWLLVGGPVAMAVYKAVNTLDSLFGYRNDRYREFGWCAARCDDLMNWVPARLTAALVWLVALLTPSLNATHALLTVWRDAARQPSPNSGYPEAAVAGALGVQLGGLNFYGGVPSPKATLGQPLRPLHWNLYPSLRFILYAVPLGGSALLWLGVSLWP